MTDPNPPEKNFRSAVQALDAYRRMLVDAKADPSLVEAITAIVRHLYKMPPRQVEQLYGRRGTGAQQALKEKMISEAANLKLSDIEEKLSQNDLSRAELEAIAIGRFHAPKGSMRSMGNIDHLKDRLWSFVQNEKTHRIISELGKSNTS